jgi:hypothetical protein
MIGMSGPLGVGGGLYAAIDSSDGDVSHSSMSLATVTAANNTAGMMRWALLWQHDLLVVPVDSEWLCVREGWGLVGGVWAVLREQAALLRIGQGTLTTVRACTLAPPRRVHWHRVWQRLKW